MSIEENELEKILEQVSDQSSEEYYTSDEEDDEEQEEEDSNLSSRILNELKNGTYTCLVCTEELDDSAEIWSCGFCYRVYDLECIQDWAIKDSKNNLRSDTWRCPSCKNETLEIPSAYTCWCGKVINPARNVFSPHSCGQTCSEPLKTCIHTCALPCHPGPHSEICQALPKLKCHCGKNKKQFSCSMAPYENGWKCDDSCDELMHCGVHKHQGKCHSGLCGPCEELVDVACYCGKHETQIKCHEKIDIDCENKVRKWIGSYQCQVGEKCNEVLDCDNPEHSCQIKYCHPHNESFDHKCLLNPKIMTKCPCGKNSITELLHGQNRKTCMDPVPTCEEICDKVLECGHTCYWKCHSGNEHAKCYQTIEMDCRCGFSKYLVPCGFKQSGYQPTCFRKCQALKNCRRHRCGNICCPFEKIAYKRDKDRRKNNFKSVAEALSQPLGQQNNNRHDEDNMTIEAVHVCLEPCNQLLSCKIHRCQWQDHPGKCPPCLESSSNDLMCGCGKTVLIEAPVRCGVVPKTRCNLDCHRPRSCGHKAGHLCHDDFKECPKCTELVNRSCACGKKVIKGIYCFQERVNCGAKCDKLLSCGIHTCQKVCCDKDFDHSNMKCESVCGKKRSICGHPHKAKCHWPIIECSEKLACTTKIKLYCVCKRLSILVDCEASINKTSRLGEVIECDSECLRIKRNKQLFLAFSMGTADDFDEFNSANSNLANVYSDYLLSVYAKQTRWCEQIETVFRDLVANWQKNPDKAKKSHHFPVMRKAQRTFVHHLSDLYGLFSESQDSEPKRSVFVSVTSNSTLPSISLAEAIKNNKKSNEFTNFAMADYNSIILENCELRITIDELEKSILPIFQEVYPQKSVTIKWKEDGKFLVHTDNFKSFNREDELLLMSVLDKLIFKLNIKESKLGFKKLRLCKIDLDGMTIVKYGDYTESMKKKLKDDENKVIDYDSNSIPVEKSVSEISMDSSWY